ncbi:hypothetical protein ACWD5O_30570, partial [Micromonospora sp. NPDC005161]
MPSHWTALPESVTTGIAERVGGAVDVTPASSGNHAEIASTVTGPAGKVFVKAATGELSVRSLRYELAATGAIDRHPPAVLWQFESDGWLVVGTEHLAGPHPGSRQSRQVMPSRARGRLLSRAWWRLAAAMFV